MTKENSSEFTVEDLELLVEGVKYLFQEDVPNHDLSKEIEDSLHRAERIVQIDSYDDWEPRCNYKGHCPECKGENIEWNFLGHTDDYTTIVECVDCGTLIKSKTDLGHAKQAVHEERESRTYYELRKIKIQESDYSLQQLMKWKPEVVTE